MSSRIESNLYIQGTLQAETLIPSATCVADSHVTTTANIAHTKHENRMNIPYGQTGTMVAATVPLYRCYSTAGEILSVHAGSITLCTGNAAATVDVKKNGTTILTGTITLNSSNTARVGAAGTLAVTTLAAGDLIEVVIAVNAGTGALGTGLFVDVHVAEDGI